MLGRWKWMLVCAVLVCLGCSPDYVKPGVYVEVHGKVLLDGGPVSDAKVYFVPDELEIGEEFVISFGTTNTFGEFELETIDDREGALVGKHRVFISRVAPDYGIPDPETPNRVRSTEANRDGVDEIDFAKYREHVWDLIDKTVQQPAGERIPFYYNLNSELTFEVIPGRGIQRVTFELSSVDPMLND